MTEAILQLVNPKTSQCHVCYVANEHRLGSHHRPWKFAFLLLRFLHRDLNFKLNWPLKSIGRHSQPIVPYHWKQYITKTLHLSISHAQFAQVSIAEPASLNTIWCMSLVKAWFCQGSVHRSCFCLPIKHLHTGKYHTKYSWIESPNIPAWDGKEYYCHERVDGHNCQCRVFPAFSHNSTLCKLLELSHDCAWHEFITKGIAREMSARYEIEQLR